MNRSVIITGGSRGIGAATAILAARKGYEVCVNFLSNEKAALKVVDHIIRNGGKAIALQADVSSESEVANMFRTVDSSMSPLWGLVNNAGILETQMRFEDMKTDRWERILKSNVMSCFHCSKEAIRRLSAKHGGAGGSIVNVGSIASLSGSPGEYVDYAAAKGAVDSLTRGLSRELACEGIRVNAVRPAFIYTDIHASGGEPGRVDRIKDLIPMKRGGQPEEVAEAIVWLLSDEASYCTGTFIDLAGGR
ncbi:SDR family oxidoreductase [Daejeonella sp. JGW-45]|uniref:SDR family oxidoreductase n=1 Tax=Daejeonella sp. JGW-45 TaxID=3034148 RepID=UPI0023ECB37C|nr:SDR family oxidoreductase [Daejeonella sp. JGW-45]